jgi:hypothetical protein
VSSYVVAGGRRARGPDRYDNKHRSTDHNHRCCSNRNDDHRCCSEHALDHRYDSFVHAISDARDSRRDWDNTRHRDDSHKTASDRWHQQLRCDRICDGKQHCKHDEQHDGTEGINVCHGRNDGRDLSVERLRDDHREQHWPDIIVGHWNGWRLHWHAASYLDRAVEPANGWDWNINDESAEHHESTDEPSDDLEREHV